MKIPKPLRVWAKQVQQNPDELRGLAELFETNSVIYKKLVSGNPSLYIIARAINSAIAGSILGVR